MKLNFKAPPKGFTLIEILVVIGIIAVLASIVIVAINPARQFAQARDTQRLSNLNTILNAIGQNMADNKGIFTCNGINLPNTSGVDIYNGSGGGVDLSCLVPTYISIMPTDPSASSGNDTGYQVWQDQTTGRVYVSASAVEPSIPRTTPLQVIR